MEINSITDQIIGAAFTVHHELGPGLLESAYHRCMVFELLNRGLHVDREKKMPIVYQGKLIHRGYRLDLLINQQVIVEMKAVARLDSSHTAQLLTYLKLTNCSVGLLINFNSPLLRDGIRRVVLNYTGPTPRNPRIPRLNSADDEEPPS